VVHALSPTAAQNHYMKAANKLFEIVAEFKYLGTTVTHLNCVRDEINSRLNSGFTCCHEVLNIVFFRLLSNLMKYYKNTDL
jgi:hypothetical protein